MAQPETDVEKQWRDLFTNEENAGHQIVRRIQRIWKHVPGSPRCRVCSIPLGGPATPLLKFSKRAPSSGNPHFCNKCEMWVSKNPGGTELEMTYLFADVRGSTTLAEKMGPGEFAQLMHAFYKTANRILIKSDAWMDKPVGDEIVALYLPIFARDHAAKAVEGARELLEALGEEGWSLEVGGGVHTGVAYLGTVGVEGSESYDLTVLGDAVNVTSRLASVARAGEMLVSEEASRAAGLDVSGLEHRMLQLKGREEPLGVYVLS